MFPPFDPYPGNIFAHHFKAFVEATFSCSQPFAGGRGTAMETLFSVM
jgi:hypothetical protein